MNNDAEPVLAALLSYFQTNLGSTFPIMGRRLAFWTNVNQLPALYIRHKKTLDRWQGPGLQKSELEVELWIYCQHGESDVPSSVLNALLLSLRNAMAPDNPMTQTFTIGGACYWCRIDGETELFPGDTTDRDIAIIPVRIILP